MTESHAARSLVDPRTYRENLFLLLCDRDPLEVLAQTAISLDRIVSAHPVNVLRSRPIEGEWTPNEIIGHLGDGEWVYGCRLRWILSEDNPSIVGTNQDRWVARQNHNDRDPAELVEMFRALRECNLALWKRISPTDLNRTGHHNERGAESLALMLPMWAGHDFSHLNQINRYLQTLP